MRFYEEINSSSFLQCRTERNDVPMILNYHAGGITLREQKKRSKMVYTPQCRIPIGEAVKTENGEYALRIKKPKSKEVEIIPIGSLVTRVAMVAEAVE